MYTFKNVWFYHHEVKVYCGCGSSDRVIARETVLMVIIFISFVLVISKVKDAFTNSFC